MDILIIKVSDDSLLTHFRMDQNYSEVDSMVTALILRHHPGKTAAAYALADADTFQGQIDLGKTLGNTVGVDSDFNVQQKSAVTTETIIPPEGIAEVDLLGTDDVVCYA